jgi:hypothetical protein
MISCTEFIPVYSEAFKFFHSRGGDKDVIAFWESLSDAYLGPLRELAQRKGLRGCFEWWTKALEEEAADFCTTLDEDEGVLEIYLRRCPSMAQLLELKHVQPFDRYCEHCDTLYRRALEQLGFDYKVDLSRCQQAECKRYVIRKKRK